MPSAQKIKYPLLRVNLAKLKHNIKVVNEECLRSGIKIWGVPKGVSSPVEVARLYEEVGVEVLADSRLDNIRRMKEGGVNCKYALIRIPMRTELEEAVDLCDYILVSDIGTMEVLEQVCERRGKDIKCVVMFDMGDLREGFWFKDAETVARALVKFNGRMKISGVGANFSCACGVLPTNRNVSALIECGKTIERVLRRPLEIYSGGGTCSFVQLRRGNLPKGVNSLRVGEAILLGQDAAFDVILPGLAQDTMRLEAELVEVRTKPTMPIGERGRDSFGNLHEFVDHGNRRRGVLAVGKQDVYADGLTPLDPGVHRITASSDHLLVDIEERPDLKVGDILSFLPNYPAMLSASTSPYITKVYE